MPEEKQMNSVNHDIRITWLCDGSDSMKAKGKMCSLNAVIREITDEIRNVSSQLPDVKVNISAIKFGKNSEWIQKEGVQAESFIWSDLVSGGSSDLGHACLQIAEEIKSMKSQNITTDSTDFIFILITDGYPTDDWCQGFEVLKSTAPQGHSYYCAIRIQDSSEELIESFCSDQKDPEFFNMDLDNVEKIIHLIRMISKLSDIQPIF